MNESAFDYFSVAAAKPDGSATLTAVKLEWVGCNGGGKAGCPANNTGYLAINKVWVSTGTSTDYVSYQLPNNNGGAMGVTVNAGSGSRIFNVLYCNGASCIGGGLRTVSGNGTRIGLSVPVGYGTVRLVAYAGGVPGDSIFFSSPSFAGNTFPSVAAGHAFVSSTSRGTGVGQLGIGQEVFYQYDAAGVLRSADTYSFIHNPQGVKIETSYYSRGKVYKTEKYGTDGKTVTNVTTFEYDADGKMISSLTLTLFPTERP